jgi:hypothetical protein
MPWMLGMMAATKRSAEAADLAVCLRNAGVADQFTLYRAQALTTGMFGAIGVRVEWNCGKNAAGTAVVELDRETPADFKPGALAYALAYRKRGSHIHVFYDRVRRPHTPSLTPVLLGHVFVHQITHVLEGIARHSQAGVMKGRWDRRDFEEMAHRPLWFAPEDVEMICARTARRAAI